ncbi:MAG: response regulator [Desulfobulbaceae bacterium]
MTHTPSSASDLELRNKAEARLLESRGAVEERLSAEEAQLLLHELQVHQIELEMQNEELRRAQHDIDALRARYFDLYNLAPVGYVTLSEQGMIVEANLTSANLLGVTRSALVKRPFSHFVFAEDQDRYYLYRKQLIETGGAPQECELRLLRADGSFFWLHLQAISARETETTTECRIVMRDIMEQRQLEERLREAQKVEAIGTLAGGIAHNFNNILVPILGYAELAESKLAPDDPLTSDLRHIVKGALRAKDMIAQILAFSRKTPEKRQSFQPQLVVTEALKLLQASLPATITLKTEIAADCGTIMADPTQLHQIVMNLCVNAHHAMVESGGVLKVGLEKVIVGKEESKVLGSERLPGEYIVLEVSDSGCGMDSETLARIFEPYFTTKCQGEGSGPGLSVVHGMVKKYQGHIGVQSEPGKGTRFQVYLPACAEEVFLKAGESSVPVTAGTERILVVDDEEVITTMFQTILARSGYQVIIFNNSLEALAFISQDPTAFDLLLTDMRMPHLSGLELIEKALAVRPDLPVILCTGFNKQVDKEEAAALGVHVCLEKPVSVRELILVIRKALDEKGKVSG